VNQLEHHIAEQKRVLRVVESPIDFANGRPTDAFADPMSGSRDAECPNFASFARSGAIDFPRTRQPKTPGFSTLPRLSRKNFPRPSNPLSPKRILPRPAPEDLTHPVKIDVSVQNRSPFRGPEAVEIQSRKSLFHKILPVSHCSPGFYRDAAGSGHYILAARCKFCHYMLILNVRLRIVCIRYPCPLGRGHLIRDT
jgi:hypothetical protein